MECKPQASVEDHEREESLLWSAKRRRFVPTTDSDHTFGRYPNLIKAVEKIDGLDQVWISDITYIRLPTTFCYLTLWALEMALSLSACQSQD